MQQSKLSRTFQTITADVRRSSMRYSKQSYCSSESMLPLLPWLLRLPLLPLLQSLAADLAGLS